MKRAPLFAFALAAIAVLAASAQDTTRRPASFEELVETAQQAQRQNDLSTAALRYKEALKMRPDIPELHANVGLVDYQLGDAADASHEFQTALHLKPSLFVPNLFLGIEYLERNEPSSALKYLSRAAQLNPRDLEVNLSLGRAYSALDKNSDAISAYLNAVTFHPGSEDGWYGLGTSYLDRAESLSNLLATRDRDSAAFRALTAEYLRIQMQNGKSPAATALRLPEELKDDRSSEPGQAYLAGHYRTAASLGEKSIASGTLSPTTLYWTIKAYQQLGVRALTQAVNVAPGSIRIHLLLGDLYRRRGQYLAGQQEFQEALKLDKNKVPALLGLATTLYLNGDSGSAEKIASQALSHEPDDPELRLLMAEILLAQHRYADAYRYVVPLPNGKPDLLAEIHGVRGKIFAATHHPREAIAELKRAVDKDPQGDFTYVLARQYQLLGDKQSADAAFQRSKMLRQRFNERASYKFKDHEQN